MGRKAGANGPKSGLEVPGPGGPSKWPVALAFGQDWPKSGPASPTRGPDALLSNLKNPEFLDRDNKFWVPEGSLAGFVWVGFWGLGGPWGL